MIGKELTVENGIFYEVGNPSDQVTFYAKDVESAALALALVGNGQYNGIPLDSKGNEVEDEEKAKELRIPFFMFGGMDEWCQALGYESADEMFRQKLGDTADALETFCTGSVKERKLFESSLKYIDDEEKRAAFIAEWDDKKRTSLNDITNSARKIAENIRRTIAEGV